MNDVPVAVIGQQGRIKSDCNEWMVKYNISRLQLTIYLSIDRISQGLGSNQGGLNESVQCNHLGIQS
jgi:hypothetical protein